MNSFHHMVNQTLHEGSSTPELEVSCANYDSWQKQLVFDMLRGYKTGRSFCEFFGISNACPLYFFSDHEICMRWINDFYLGKK
jgi:hypothetical protein